MPLRIISLLLMLASCGPKAARGFDEQRAVVHAYLEAGSRADRAKLAALSLDSVLPWAMGTSPARREVLGRASQDSLRLLYAQRSADTVVLGFAFPFVPDSLKCPYWEPPLQAQLVQRDGKWLVRWMGLEIC
jgi:hypothetical protein